MAKSTVLREEMRDGDTGARNEEEDTFNSSTQAKQTKLRKFIFVKETKTLLLQAMRRHNAHRSAHVKKDETFENFNEKLVQNLPECVWRRYHKPTMKTVREKLRYLIAKRRQTDKRISTTSGVKVVNWPVEELLDEFIAETNQLDQKRRRKHDSLTQE